MSSALLIQKICGGRCGVSPVLALGLCVDAFGNGVFIWFVKNEPISDFEPLKPALYTLFIAVGVGSCLFVKDFFAVRGLAVVIMLLAKVMVDTARFHDSSWRLVIITWAYLLVVAGIVFTISPYRMRDVICWKTANESRTRILSGLEWRLVYLLPCSALRFFKTSRVKFILLF